MKTMFELLPVVDSCNRVECAMSPWCKHDVELVAQRAREEMREMAVAKILELLDENSSRTWFLRDALRALPVKV